MDTDDLTRMLVELGTGASPSLQTPDADAMRALLQQQRDAIHAQGGSVEIPSELPDLTDD